LAPLSTTPVGPCCVDVCSVIGRAVTGGGLVAITGVSIGGTKI
jgi:hypothetical protein